MCACLDDMDCKLSLMLTRAQVHAVVSFSMALDESFQLLTLGRGFFLKEGASE